MNRIELRPQKRPNVMPTAAVLPPTETAGAPSVADVTFGASPTDGTINMTMPTNSAGDRVFISVACWSQHVDATPSGWTALVDDLNNGGGEAWYLYYKDITSTTSSVSIDTTGVGNMRWAAFTVKNPGAQFVSSTYVANSTTKNPPAITPSAGAGDYLVLTFNWGQTAENGDAGGSTGYTDIHQATSSGIGIAWHHIQKQVVAIATTEDPDSYVWGGVGSVSGGFTVAILGEAGSVSPIDHTHPDEDIDSEAALDGQILTADGAGGATWEYPGNLYVATADATIANSTTETSLIGTGVGSLTLPADYLAAGTVVKVDMRGRIAATGNPNRTIKLKLGSTVITSIGPTAIATISGTVEWRIELMLTCRTVGASGVVVAGGFWTHSNGTFRSLSSGTDVNVDTTGTLALDVTWQWGTASASNTITCREAVVE